jgi:IS605 OrfB family transposase
MITTYSYRIKDGNCADTLLEMARSVNIVWNFCNESQEHALRWNQPWPRAFDLSNLTAGCSKELGLHSQTVQAVCEEYATRRQQARKRKLRWRGKRSLGWIPFKAVGIKVANDTVRYAGHTFRFWLHRPIEGQIKTGSFSQDARGRWYVNFHCEIEAPDPSTGTGSVGIDLGLKDLATLSTGEKIEAKQFYRDLEPLLAIAQRAGKKKRVKAIHAKIKNRRQDFLHKESTRLVRENGAIFIGDVNASALAKTKMAKSILDASWSAFRTMLAYKAIAQQVRFDVVNERFSTQLCSECGALSGPKGIAEIGIREWVCSECGTHHDRDVNSAKLILRAGHRTLAGGSLAL